LKAAGISVAYQPKLIAVRMAAQHVVEGDLSDVLAVVQADAYRDDNRTGAGAA
jgi:hypothetical protein